MHATQALVLPSQRSSGTTTRELFRRYNIAQASRPKSRRSFDLTLSQSRLHSVLHKKRDRKTPLVNHYRRSKEKAKHENNEDNRHSFPLVMTLFFPPWKEHLNVRSCDVVSHNCSQFLYHISLEMQNSLIEHTGRHKNVRKMTLSYSISNLPHFLTNTKKCGKFKSSMSFC